MQRWVALVVRSLDDMVRLTSVHLSRDHARLGDFAFQRRVLGLEPLDTVLRRRDDLKYRFEANKPAYTQTLQAAKDYCLWLGELRGYPISASALASC